MTWADDADWHDRINRMDDDAKNQYFREKDAKEQLARLEAAGKKFHICHSCQEIIECD